MMDKICKSKKDKKGLWSELGRRQLVYGKLERLHTWWHRVLDHREHRGLKTPVSLPVGHGFARFEVLSKMVHTRSPGVEDDAAETATGANFWRSHLPRLHGPVSKLHIVHEAQMLIQVVLPVKCSFFEGAFLAR